jgi:methyl-accepting chemotaxis protein
MINISRRLWLLTAVALLALAVVGLGGALEQRDTLMQARKDEIKSLLQMATHVVGYYREQEMQGRMSHDEAQKQAKLALTNMQNGMRSYVWVRLPDGLSIVHPNPKLVNTNVPAKLPDGRSDTDGYRQALNDAKGDVGYVELMVRRGADATLIPKLNGITAYKDWDWWIGSGAWLDDIQAQFLRGIAISFAVLGLGLTVLGFIAYRTIGQITSALGGSLDSACRAARRIASGDLAEDLHIPTTDTHSLMAQLSQMQDHLRSIVVDIRAGADSINNGAAEIADGTINLSQRTEEQAASLQATSASLDQMAETVRANTENSNMARNLADETAELASDGASVVDEMMVTMNGIHESARRIQDIIGVIDGIAFQTNILALNAAVEAARAGEQGRGFAVVASEVRTLAQRSATAAKEISQLIKESTEKVEAGAELAQKTGTTVQNMLASVMNVSGLVREVSDAATHQSSRLDEISGSLTKLDGNTQQNAALCEESAAASQSLAGSASRLLESVSVFKVA